MIRSDDSHFEYNSLPVMTFWLGIFWWGISWLWMYWKTASYLPAISRNHGLAAFTTMNGTSMYTCTKSGRGAQKGSFITIGTTSLSQRAILTAPTVNAYNWGLPWSHTIPSCIGIVYIVVQQGLLDICLYFTDRTTMQNWDCQKTTVWATYNVSTSCNQIIHVSKYVTRETRNV